MCKYIIVIKKIAKHATYKFYDDTIILVENPTITRYTDNIFDWQEVGRTL